VCPASGVLALDELSGGWEADGGVGIGWAGARDDEAIGRDASEPRP